MPYFNPFDNLDETILNTFGVDSQQIEANLFPQSQPDVAVPINGIFQKPNLREQIMPGVGFGVSVIRLFVRIQDITPQPQKSDTLEIGSATYDIDQVLVDSIGGATLVLRNKRT